MAKSTAVAKKGGNKLPAESDLFEQYASAGLEEVKASDMLIPRLTILQSLSPQLNKKRSEFIEGSEIGSIADVGTGEIFPDGVLFLPVLYRKDFLEWAPRASGKGLVAVHNDPKILDACSRNEKNQPVLPSGNYISETAQFFGLNLSAGRRKCFVPMASTQLKKARRWITLATSEKLNRADGTEFTAPLFYRAYMLTTAEESNAEGEWAGWKIERDVTAVEAAQTLGVPWPIVRGEIVEFLESLQRGEAKADIQEPGADNGTEGRM